MQVARERGKVTFTGPEYQTLTKLGTKYAELFENPAALMIYIYAIL